MKNKRAGWLLAGVASLALIGGVGAEEFDEELYDWQVERLFEPTPDQESWEHSGNIFIYESMKETDIERALEEEFERIQHMMFVRTIVTDEEGEAETETDEEGGLSLIYQDDGC